MDQATWEHLMANVQSQFRAAHPQSDLTAVAGQFGKPLVVLVHGIGGDARHWSNPTAIDTAVTWLFDLDAVPPPISSGITITQSPAYPANAVTTWCQALTNQQISYINWSQSAPEDCLDIAVQELVAILQMVEGQLFGPLTQDTSNTGPLPALILLCHSRGGLVARAALKQIGKAGVPHLQKIITLSTPHHGSYMPKLSSDYDTTLRHFLDFSHVAGQIPAWLVPAQLGQALTTLAGKVSASLLRTFGAPGQGPGFGELVPDSDTMRDLAANEQPLPGVQYIGYGGSNPIFVKFYLNVVHWTPPGIPTASPTIVDQLTRAIPNVATKYGNLAELALGDSAVSLGSSQWPAQFNATYQSLPFNHMQALINTNLQQAVLDAIH
ncbi:MAG: hypothetical protein H0X37_26185 [Herpetosiphonaceae bacterium]|nr:hypothetical protein [Herpetosiphonaceae bacterium]